MHDITQLLSALGQGDPHAAGRLLPLADEELRNLAAPAQGQQVVTAVRRRADKKRSPLGVPAV